MKFLSVAISSLLITPAKSFAPSSFLSSPHSSITKNHKYTIEPQPKTSTSLCSSIGTGLSGKVVLTPEGYGFSSSTDRVLSQAKRGNNGYYKANSNDKVIDVMGGMTNGPEDVALVYQNGNLQGIFTETDYIEVSTFGLGHLDLDVWTWYFNTSKYQCQCYVDTLYIAAK